MILVLLLILVLSVVCNYAVWRMLTTDPSGYYIARRDIRAWAAAFPSDPTPVPLEILS